MNERRRYSRLRSEGVEVKNGAENSVLLDRRRTTGQGESNGTGMFGATGV